MTDASNSDDFPPIPLHPPVPHTPAPFAPPPGDRAAPLQRPPAPHDASSYSPTEPPPGYTAHRPGHTSAPTFDQPGNWFGAIAAALGIQIAAAFVLGFAAAIAVIAAIAEFGDSSSDASWFFLLAIPLALVAVALYIISGLVASRIARDGRGWLMLIAGPAMFGALSVLLGVFGR